MVWAKVKVAAVVVVRSGKDGLDSIWNASWEVCDSKSIIAPQFMIPGPLSGPPSHSAAASSMRNPLGRLNLRVYCR